MNNDCNKIPLTTALLAAREDARPLEDVLRQLAEQGLDAARRLLASTAQLADFSACASSLYAEARSRKHAVEKHTERLRVLERKANAIAGAAVTLAETAEAEGIRREIFSEVAKLACNAARMARKVNEQWKGERARILQQNELEGFRFQVAVALVRNELRRQAAEVVTTDEIAEETAAAA